MTVATERRGPLRSKGPTVSSRPESTLAVRLGSLVVLVAVALGVPGLMIGIKAKPPWSVVAAATLHPVSAIRSLGGPTADLTAVDAAIVVVWMAWIWLLLCLAAEVVGHVRGKPTTRLPVSRHIQALLAVLVSASIAVIPSARLHVTTRMSALGGQQLNPTLLLAKYEFQSHPASTGSSAQSGSLLGEKSSSPADRRIETQSRIISYVVKPGDTMWSIAAEELGSPLRWREIAILNLGRVQDDGRTLTQAGWILPGWVLFLPGSGTEVRRGATKPPDPSHPHGDASRENKGELPSRRVSPTIEEHRSLLSGADPAGKEVSSRPTADETSLEVQPSPIPTGRQHPDSASVPNQSDPSKENHRNVPLAPFGYGLLGAGVVMIINRLRRAQQRHRPVGRRIALPDDDLIGAEQLLRSSADYSAADWIDACLRILVASCRRHGRRPPNVVAVRVFEQATELILGDPGDVASAVEPFENSREKSSWVLPRESQILEEARVDPWIAGMDVISPALVTLGRDQSGLLLVDIEQAGSVSVFGEEADDVIRAMAIELATSRWSEQVNVVLVGMERGSETPIEADPTLDILDRVRMVGDIVEILPELRHIASERELMLDTIGARSTSDARKAVSGDGWDLTAVFCSRLYVSTNHKAVSELVSLAGDGTRGLAVVCATEKPVGTNWHLTTGDGPMSIKMSGVSEAMIWPQTVDDDAGEQIAKLVDVAQRFEGVEPSVPARERQEGVENTEGSAFPLPAVEIRVLGPVEVVGAARPFTRAWSLELVVYLAMHPGGASSDQWATHLWPSRSMAQASLHSTASAARRALGSTADGEDHLPRSHGRLSLGPGVRTDWDRFCQLAESPDPERWKLALQLVRGLPFDGLRSTDWAVFSHVQANIESLVVDISVRRAEYCLSVGDSMGAGWAGRQGLLVSPYDERLYRILMRAADLAGNPAGVEGVMNELLQLVGDEIEPYDSIHPETYELYRTLSRRQAAPSRHR
jgi:DNA-binding SARP family transcriptional activator